MVSVTATGGSSAAKVDAAEAQRRAEEARQKAEAARNAAEAKRKAAEAARNAVPKAQREANAARGEKTAADKAAAAARKAAEKPGQTPEEAKKSKEALAAAETKRQAAAEASKLAAQKLQAAEEKAALAGKQAEEAMLKANATAIEENKTPPYSEKDIAKVKPTKSELDSAFEGTSRKAELEKLLGLTPPPQPVEVVLSPLSDGAPASASEEKGPFEKPFWQTHTPQTRPWLHEGPGPLGDVGHSHASGGGTVTGSQGDGISSPVTSRE